MGSSPGIQPDIIYSKGSATVELNVKCAGETAWMVIYRQKNNRERKKFLIGQQRKCTENTKEKQIATKIHDQAVFTGGHERLQLWRTTEKTEKTR